MRKPILALSLVALMAGGAAAQSSELKEAFKNSTPTRRLAARELLHERYAGLPEALAAHLDERYPNFEVRGARAFLALRQKYPGLPFAAARHLLEDLGDEPAQAFLDVQEAVLARYPDFPARMARLRQQHRPRLAVAEAVEARHPGFRTAFLQLLGRNRADSPRGLAWHTLREKHPGLALRLLGDLSELADREQPGLVVELMRARRRGERPLLWLAENHPGFLARAARELHTRHKTELRSAALDVLKALEIRSPGTSAEAVLGLIEKDYPELPATVRTARRQARQSFRQAVLAEFPELPSVVARTLEEKHPRLLTRALESLESHYPELRQDALAALETELPGLKDDLQGFVKANYPNLVADLTGVLQGGR